MRLPAQFAAAVVIAGLVAGGWYFGDGGSDIAAAKSRGKRKAPATPVLTEATTFAEDTVRVRAIGTAKAIRSATLHPSVSGEVVSVSFRAGQRVRQGEILLQLDDDHQRLAVQLAQVAVKEAERQVNRLQTLKSTGATSSALLLTARSELESARLNLATTKQALADRTIVAPFNGVIGLTSIEPGDRVDDKTAIATLDDRSRIRVQFSIPEAYAGLVELNDPIAVEPRALKGKRLTGTISALDSRIDELTRSLKAQAMIDNPNDAIRPGTSFEVIQEFTGGSYPIIREVAVLWSRDGAYLWRARDGKADKVFVRVVRRDKGRILVEGPLKRGDDVVVEGVQGLRIGQALAPRPFTQPGS